MFRRQTSGSVVCPSCGTLVGVNDERCFNCGRWNPGMWGYTAALRRLGNDFGFVPLVIGGCSVLYLLTLLPTLMAGGGLQAGGGMMSILSPSWPMLFLFGGSGTEPVFGYGRWWTVVSAAWLHGSLLHILFNMLWVRQLGPATADVYGAGRMIIIYTIAGVCGFLLTSVAGYVFVTLPLPLGLRGLLATVRLTGAFRTIGASAPIFGLLGALVHYGKRGGGSVIGSQAMTYAVVIFVFGVIMPGVDNYAHAGGFAGGYLASMWLDPLKPERVEHLVAAFACIALVVVTILASIVTGLPMLQ